MQTQTNSFKKLQTRTSNHLKKFSIQDIDQILEQQESCWDEHCAESLRELVDLCKQNDLDYKMICRLAWDIVEMSKEVPCFLDNKKTLDMSRNVCNVIQQFAVIEEQHLIDHQQIKQLAKFISIGGIGYLSFSLIN